MGEHEVERPRHLGEIQRLDEEARVSDLPAAAAAHEAPKLLLLRPSLPRWLLLERAERSEITVSVDDLLDRVGAESADQLVLEVYDAYVEAQPFHVDARQVGAKTGSFETAPEIAFLCDVAKTRQPDVRSLRAEPIQEASDRLRTPDRHDGDSLGLEIPTTAPSERLERDLVADAFDEHDRTRFQHPRMFTSHARER
jgi:hypothetical protein